MRKLIVPIGVVVLILAAAFVVIGVAAGQGTQPRVLSHEAQDGNVREVTAPPDGKAPDQPNIGFIDSPSATCYQPDHTQNNCYINWYYMSVSASPNYMITMTAILNDFGPVAHTQGFFQTSMYVPVQHAGPGLQGGRAAVAGRAAIRNWATAYAYTIRARDSANLSSANYGTVYCPPFTP